MNENTELVLIEQIEPLIRTVRSQNVLLDSDLALLYAVPTKALNQAVKRNQARFPMISRSNFLTMRLIF